MAHNNRPMRRSALIGPWGVGAIVPFPNDESLMIAGLDMWRYNDATPFVIKDERLLRRLGVQELRWPPDFRENNADPQNCFLKISYMALLPVLRHYGKNNILSATARM